MPSPSELQRQFEEEQAERQKGIDEARKQLDEKWKKYYEAEAKLKATLDKLKNLEKFPIAPPKNIAPTVRCTIQEFDGEGEWGTHNFLFLPRRHEVIEIWTNGGDLLARVEDVRHVEYNVQEDCGGDIILFVKRL